MLEVRYYLAKRVIAQDEAVRLYDQILGDGKGRALSVGDASQRRQLVEGWLTQRL